MKILNKELNDKILNYIIDLARAKKELANLDSCIITKILSKYLIQNTKILNFLINYNGDIIKLKKNKMFISLIKFIRKEARQMYGLFQKPGDIEKRNKLLIKLKNYIDQKNIEEIKSISQDIMMTHVSTSERIDYYFEIYDKINLLVPNLKSILDLGCGLNPVAYTLIGLNNIEYYASELNYIDSKFLDDYLKIAKIKGKATEKDLTEIINNPNLLKVFPKTDICFLFKILDGMDNKGHKVSEALIKAINSKFLLISFATRKISGRFMDSPRRKWLELMLERLNYPYEIFEINHELFYFVTKLNS